MELAVPDNTLSVVPDFQQSWLAGQLSPHTTRAYASDIRQFLEFVKTDNLAAVRRDDIHRFRSWLVANRLPKTVNRKLSVIRQLFEEAVLQGVVATNPAVGIRGHRVSAKPTGKAPSSEQVAALLASLDGGELPQLRDRAMIYLMAALGLRRAEVAGLRVSSVTQTSGVTVLTWTSKGNKVGVEPIPDTALAAVRAWIDAAHLGPTAPLFQELRLNHCWRPTGNALSGNGVYYIVMRRMEAVGIEGCSPHSLRRFIITRLYELGCPPERIQRLALHSDLQELADGHQIRWWLKCEPPPSRFSETDEGIGIVGFRAVLVFHQWK